MNHKELSNIPSNSFIWIKCGWFSGILVNCVGRMYEYPDEFGNVPFEVLWSLINMNIGAMLTTTRIVVNRMKKQKKGAIINISSGSELQPVPYATLYAASKVNFYSFLPQSDSQYNYCFLGICSAFYTRIATWARSLWHNSSTDHSILCPN